MVTWVGVCLLAGCRAGPRQEVLHVAVAASTQEAVRQIADAFRRETGAVVECNAAASSELARQIEHGGNADLFLSADEAWADYLAEKNLVAQRRDLLANRLVVVVPKETTLVLNDLRDLAKPAVTRLALAGAAVPAGRYARQALKKAGVWHVVEDRVLEGKDVRAALTYVARGEAEAGIVYATDVVQASTVRTALSVNADLHDPIRYPLVLVRRERLHPAAQRFFDCLSSETAAAVFRAAGFRILP
jgi:molybdate transport system substrate-binding protein